MAKAHFGVTLPQIKRPWVATKDAAELFEGLGFDSLWVCDHLYGPQAKQLPIMEAWSLLAAVAAITERVELGTLVTPAGMRNQAQLGKTIASIDNIAGGRGDCRTRSRLDGERIRRLRNAISKRRGTLKATT